MELPVGMLLMYVHLIRPYHISMVLMFDGHDLDESFQSDYDHSITYERVLHAYDDHEIIDLGTVIGLKD